MSANECRNRPPSKRKKLIQYHPYLIALYPILALYAHNIREVEFQTILRSIILSIITTTVLLILFRLLLRDFDKASLACTLSLILFFSYGHVYAALKEVSIFNVLIGRHRILAPLWLGLFLIGFWWVMGKLRDPAIAHRTLNTVLLVALIFPLIQVVDFFIHTSIFAPNSLNNNATEILQETELPDDVELPDIYYIILDGYTRQDTLREIADYDNQAFIQKLEEMGFYVASCSQSNYAQTLLSLASTLNFDYLDNLMQTFTPGNEDRYELWVLLKHSATQNLLESMGYLTIAFETGFYWSQLDDAEIFLRRSTPELQKWQYLGGFNNFEVMLFKSTLGLIVADGFMAIPKALQPDLDHPDQKHRERVLFVLDELERLPDYPSPKFIFAHIVSPHAPYVFDSEGRFITGTEDATDESREQRGMRLYTDQITYLNLRMEQILQTIIDSSERPPIIIIQADHGTNFGNRLNILNAYYLPGFDHPPLHDMITPVNTYRLIFSQYFNLDLPLLEDQAYISSYVDPYAVEAVPNECLP